MREAAAILGLDELLARKPAALSGGQRQRVAMGRAIVRHPQAFLMDEPLSNLDAKLRVQMRSEIARIQHDLGVTTIYVTHDQTEAMTMGDRVAVLRKGELQQVDTPQALYEHPVNLFVAGFIGSPAMNLFDATLTGRRLGPGGRVRRLPPARPRRGRSPPAPRCAATRAAPSSSASGPRTWRTRRCHRRPRRPADLARRSSCARPSGPTSWCTSASTRPPAMTDDMKELASDVGLEALEQVEPSRPPAAAPTVLARLNPRSVAAKGDPIELVVDTHRLHFFDPDTDLGIYGE